MDSATKELLSLNEQRISTQVEKIIFELDRYLGADVVSAEHIGCDSLRAIIKIYVDECLEKIRAFRIVGDANEIFEFLEYRINECEVRINDLVFKEMRCKYRIEKWGEEFVQSNIAEYLGLEYHPLKEEQLGKALNAIKSAVQDNIELRDKIKNDKAIKIWALVANVIALGALIVAGLSYFRPH